MGLVIKYFRLFLTQPEQFTLDWIQNNNSLREAFFPLIVFCGVIWIVLIGFNFFHNFYKKNTTTTEYLIYLVRTLIYGLFSTGIIYYFLSNVKGEEISLVDSIVFSFTVINLFIVSMVIWVLVLVLILPIVITIAKILNPVLPSFILEVNKDATNSYSFNGILGCLIDVFLYGGVIIGSIYYLFRALKSVFVCVLNFYTISWWLLITIMILSAVLQWGVSLTLWLMKQGSLSE